MFSYLNRNQLERFSIVCYPLKNFIERYFSSKPYRIFDELEIRGGSYALGHNDVQWHPNRDDYSVQQFLADKKCSIDEPKNWLDEPTYYSFVKMRLYLGPTVRMKQTVIYVGEDSVYNPEQIVQMESIAYLWREGNTYIANAKNGGVRIMLSEDCQLILNSSIFLRCHTLGMDHAHFSFKDYNVLYTVNVIQARFLIDQSRDEIVLWLQYWQQFLEHPEVKPVVAFFQLPRENIDNLLDRLSKDFSFAVSPNAFKIVFSECNEPLTEFRETNKTSSEMLELKKGLPTECQTSYLEKFNNYTMERTGI